VSADKKAHSSGGGLLHRFGKQKRNKYQIN
jgi:hypothetical protein